MTDRNTPALTQFGEFAVTAVVPQEARAAACNAVLDTVGVMLAGSMEPAARLVRDVARAEGGAPRCSVFGTSDRTGAGWAQRVKGAARP